MYRTDLRKVGDVISDCFLVEEVDTSRTRTDKPFGYQSDHYTITLSESCNGPRYDEIKGLRCEIQVRTILMDGWASVSLHLEYKQEIDVPMDLRADFNALSGLFYIADSHFEIFKKGTEEAKRTLMHKANEGTIDLNQEVNLDSLIAYANWKFPERRQITPTILLSRLILDLHKFKIKTLAEMDDNVNAAAPVIADFEKEMRKEGLIISDLASYGVIIASLDILTPKFYRSRINKPFNAGRKQTLSIIVKYRKILNEQQSKSDGRVSSALS